MIRPLSRSVVGILLAMLITMQAKALSIRDFRRYAPERQASFLSGAVSALAYQYAASGDVAKARCVRAWYFGTADKETPGPHELALEIAAAERQDADHLQIEGVILGVLQAACGSDRPVKP